MARGRAPGIRFTGAHGQPIGDPIGEFDDPVYDVARWLGYEGVDEYLEAYETPAGRAGMTRRLNNRLGKA